MVGMSAVIAYDERLAPTSGEAAQPLVNLAFDAAV